MTVSNLKLATPKDYYTLIIIHLKINLHCNNNKKKKNSL